LIGAGRLGAPYGVSLARLGHNVLLVDTNPATVEAINAGEAPFGEPGLAAAIDVNVAAGGRTARPLLRPGHEPLGLHIRVWDPQRPDSPAADLRDLQAAFDALLHHTRRTTSSSQVLRPDGNAEDLARRARATCRHLSKWPGARTSWRESSSLDDTARPYRIILGLPAGSTIAEPALRSLWAPLLDAGVPLIVTNTASAELTKYAANTYLAIQDLVHQHDRDHRRARGRGHHRHHQDARLDPRIGPAALQPGIGWGGSCFPKDLRALSSRARELGLEHQVRLLDEVDASTTTPRAQVIRLAQTTCGGHLPGRRIAVLGCAFTGLR